MCHLYSHADPILYEYRTRSIRVEKAVTSIKLENLFWETLSDIAADDFLTTNQLIAKLYKEVNEFRGETVNFTSFLRVTCMRYLEVKASSRTQIASIITKTNKRSSDINSTKPAHNI